LSDKDEYNKILKQYKIDKKNFKVENDKFQKLYSKFVDFKLKNNENRLNSTSFSEKRKYDDLERIELNKIMVEQRKIDKLKGNLEKTEFSLNILLSKLKRNNIKVEDYYYIK